MSKETDIKISVADVVLKFNEIEKIIKDIITAYVSPRRNIFFREIVLNNNILPFSNKYKILQSILADKKYKINPEFNNAIHELMNRRNIIAHSDTVMDEQLVDVDVDVSDGEPSYFPIYKPVVNIVKNGKLKQEEIDIVIKDFDLNYKIVKSELDKVMDFLKKNPAK